MSVMSTTGNAGAGGADRLIAGRYRLLSRLGRGGMGTVWRAEDELLGRQVAVKEVHLRRERSADERDQQHGRTLREARAVAQVRHPSVVGVHDVVDQDGEPWIVMELVDGVSLGSRLAEAGPLGPREAAELGVAVLGALEAAHARGVLHRDVKPDNVLLERETGRVVLTDFGIARLDGSATLTEDGAFLGSPEFTAPERTEGRPAGPASDLWSVGVLLCAALEGRSPFRRDSMSGVLYAVLYEDIVLPASVEPLAEVVRGLLQRDPAQRCSAAQAVRLLNDYLERGAGTGFGANGAHGASPTAETFAAAPGTARPVPMPDRPTATAVRAAGSVPTAERAVPAPIPSTAVGSGRGDGRRSLLLRGGVTLVGAAAVAAGAFLLVPTLGTAGPEPSAVASLSPSATPRPSASASPSVVQPTARPSTDDNAAPVGYTLRHDSAGFSLAVPVGWARSSDSAGRVFYLSPDRAFRIGVHPTPIPPGGVFAELKSQDAAGPTTNPGYHQGTVRPTVFHGSSDAALWQWSWNGYTGPTGDGFGPRQVQDLCWTESGRSYDFWVSAPTSRQSEAEHYFQVVSATFRVG